MTASILVTGGTGTLGRPVAQRLRDAGASVTVLSRRGDRGNRQPQWLDDRRLDNASVSACEVAQPLRPGPQQRPAATPHQPIIKGAAVTAGRRYCLPEFTIRASCLS
ncbi:MAG TPA: KR domain-containing protein [Streptosporangiaceae bacterium]|jgi:nucleoside-diphosphate-sugar epimerase|nr:KR domain-containing protein [Streptosporangiaceae bacterium]